MSLPIAEFEAAATRARQAGARALEDMYIWCAAEAEMYPELSDVEIVGLWVTHDLCRRELK